MKNLLLILALIIMIYACKKKSSSTTSSTTATAITAPPCGIDINKLKDVLWQPVQTFLAKLTFSANSSYYENATNIGTWTKIGCDSIHITGTKNFYYRITSVDNDTLRIINPTFGQKTFYK
jgi:hypothetical protein